MRVEGRWLDHDTTSGDDTTARRDFSLDLAEVADTLRDGQAWERRFRGRGDDDGVAEIVIRFDLDADTSKPYRDSPLSGRPNASPRI